MANIAKHRINNKYTQAVNTFPLQQARVLSVLVITAHYVTLCRHLVFATNLGQTKQID